MNITAPSSERMCEQTGQHDGTRTVTRPVLGPEFMLSRALASTCEHSVKWGSLFLRSSATARWW